MSTSENDQDGAMPHPAAIQPPTSPRPLDVAMSTSEKEQDSSVPSPTTAQPYAILTPGPDHVRLTRRWGRLTCVPQEQLRNNLHNGIGFLELANACDFAANVFNEIPVPTFAAVLMGVGGVVSLLLPYVALVDACRSWRNVRVLRRERFRLRQMQRGEKAVPIDVSIGLDTNFKEMGIEWVDRLLMDALMGGGGVLVGIGTLMAIAGANPSVYLVSNLLSGYIGNSFAALYGVVNTAWAGFVFLRAYHHRIIGRRRLPADTVGHLLYHRIRAVQLHAIVHGITCLVAGVASLVTATRWEGYVVLIPCIAASIWCNIYFKQHIGYDRPAFTDIPRVDEDAIVTELQAAHARTTLHHRSLLAYLESTGRELDSLPEALGFIVAHNLFQDFIESLLRDSKLFDALFPAATATAAAKQPVTEVCAEQMLDADASHVPQLTRLARACIDRYGPKQLIYRERYLLELLGNSLHYEDRRETPPRNGRRLSLRRLSMASNKARPSMTAGQTA